MYMCILLKGSTLYTLSEPFSLNGMVVYMKLKAFPDQCLQFVFYSPLEIDYRLNVP